MNEETNDFLKENLEEAHETFKYIIAMMKDNNIPYSYKYLETMEMNSYEEVDAKLRKMCYYVSESKRIIENNSELYNEEASLYFKYASLYIVSLVFLRLFHEIFDTSKLNDMVKYMVGMFLGSTYVGLLNKDLNDNKSDTKDKRDQLNELKTMKEEYKRIHDEIVLEIDYIFAVNSNLWTVLDKEKVKIR